MMISRSVKYHRPSPSRAKLSSYRPATMGCSGRSGRLWRTVKYDRADAVPASSSASTIRLVVTCLVDGVPPSKRCTLPSKAASTSAAPVNVAPSPDAVRRRARWKNAAIPARSPASSRSAYPKTSRAIAAWGVSIRPTIGRPPGQPVPSVLIIGTLRFGVLGLRVLYQVRNGQLKAADGGPEAKHDPCPRCRLGGLVRGQVADDPRALIQLDQRDQVRHTVRYRGVGRV